MCGCMLLCLYVSRAVCFVCLYLCVPVGLSVDVFNSMVGWLCVCMIACVCLFVFLYICISVCLVC